MVGIEKKNLKTKYSTLDTPWLLPSFQTAFRIHVVLSSQPYNNFRSLVNYHTYEVYYLTWLSAHAQNVLGSSTSVWQDSCADCCQLISNLADYCYSQSHFMWFSANSPNSLPEEFKLVSAPATVSCSPLRSRNGGWFLMRTIHLSGPEWQLIGGFNGQLYGFIYSIKCKRI